MAKKKYLTAKTYKKVAEAKKQTVVFESKNAKKTGESLEFPNIYRLIPEIHVRFTRFQWVMLGVSGILLVGFIIMLVFLAITSATYASLLSERDTVKKQQVYWQGILKTYPNYRDGYVMLSVLDYKLGEKNQAKIDINKALEIDPNDKQAQEFSKQVEN